jgi:outer membrane protein OmpA-like peptidoglycan-associated protein
LTDRELDLSPLLQTHDIIECKKGEWLRFSTEFIAEEPGSYLIIGNFYSDEKTEHRKVSENSLPFAYYYLDDIHVKKLEPILDVPISEDDLSLAPLDVGRTIELKNIYFDHDKADFLPRSFKELNTLVKIMKENPNMVIKIMGHTDNSGTDDYNQNLSNERAGAVVQYLRSNGITSDRMSHIGFGSKKPIASNISERGRQQNRRVEFLILRK